MSQLVAIVPTLGRSPYLRDVLDALRPEVDEVILVGPAEALDGQSGEDHLQAVPTDGALGFAEAVNRGLATEPARHAEWIALVNDDAVVQRGWGSALVSVLDAAPDVASAQGLILRMDREELVDGAGIAWNSWWQAVQLGHLHDAEPFDDAAPFEIFGASATAAVFRRRALDEVALEGAESEPGLAVLDPSLESYYEDVDLAIRLRSPGDPAWRSLCVPAARAVHAGSVTGATLAGGTTPLIRRNRYVILARLLGRGLWRRLPHAVARDLVDGLRLVERRQIGEARQVLGGALRGLARMLPEIRFHAPRVDPRDCRGRFGAEATPRVRR